MMHVIREQRHEARSLLVSWYCLQDGDDVGEGPDHPAASHDSGRPSTSRRDFGCRVRDHEERGKGPVGKWLQQELTSPVLRTGDHVEW